MIAAIRRRLASGASEAGLSLVEIIVAMMLTGILMTIVGSLVINVAKITSNSGSTALRSSVAANVMDEVSKVVRPASNNDTGGTDPDPAVVSGTISGLTVISYVDANPVSPAPTKVTFRLDAKSNLVEDRIAGTLSATGYWTFTGTTTTRTIGGPVSALTGNDALFVYLDDNGQVLTPGTTGLSLTQRQSIASIRVTIRIENALTSGSDPIIITNTVGMPNVQNSRTDS